MWTDAGPPSGSRRSFHSALLNVTSPCDLSAPARGQVREIAICYLKSPTLPTAPRDHVASEWLSGDGLGCVVLSLHSHDTGHPLY